MSIKPRELHPHLNRTNFEGKFRNFWYGNPPKLTCSKAITGRLSNEEVVKQIHKRVASILKNSVKAKIGVMGDTDVRMDDKVYRRDFVFVERIFKSKSKETIRDLEVALIKKYKRSAYKNILLNISEAKAGRLTTYNGFYYVYVVYSKKHDITW